MLALRKVVKVVVLAGVVQVANVYDTVIATVGETITVQPQEKPRKEGKIMWNFDKDAADKAPEGFEAAVTGEQKKPGKWVVKKVDDAPSKPNVLVQTGENVAGGDNFPLCVVKDSSYKNLKLSVKGKSVKGEEDKAIGLVWHYQDKDNYYVARANALENNVRLYKVQNGVRKQIGGKEDVKISKDKWHILSIEHQDDKIEVYFNGEEICEVVDKTFKEAGKIGLWTKADSCTYFDDLTAESLDEKKEDKK